MDVRFYRTEAGAEPVRDYLRGLPKAERQAAGAAIRAIQRHGLDAPGVSTRQIHGKLWEIRTSDDRIFYCVAAGPIVWLLHAYRKGSQRAPKREITTAAGRMAEVLG